MSAFREVAYKVLSNPFKYYRRAAGATFCLTALTNTGTALFDENRRTFLTTHPQIFFTGVLFKSAQFGLIFPAFYATALTSPRQAFYLGGSVEEGVKQIDKGLKDLEKEISQDTMVEIGDASNKKSWWDLPKGYNYSSTSVTRNGQTTTTTTINGQTTVTTVGADGKVITSSKS